MLILASNRPMRLLCCALVLFTSPALAADWKSWLEHYGTDQWRFPDWIDSQRLACSCSQLPDSSIQCLDGGVEVPSRNSGVDNVLSFCAAKRWLLTHMPAFDLHFLPPSVSVEGESMLDDNIAFAMMADNASTWASSLPLSMKMHYILPYASYHESRVNWRPLLFSKFFQVVADSGATSTKDVMQLLVDPNLFLNCEEMSCDFVLYPLRCLLRCLLRYPLLRCLAVPSLLTICVPLSYPLFVAGQGPATIR